MDQTTKKILDGIKLILRYEPSATFSADKGVIYLGSYLLRESMTPKHLKQLEEWGWIQENEKFARYTDD